MAIIDVVRFDGLRSRDWIIYKYPSDQLVLGTQLIVQEGQIAIFVKGGMVCDIFHAGTYTLQAQNLPILKSLINLPFGGRTPFSAEVYFINSTTKLDLSWGSGSRNPRAVPCSRWCQPAGFHDCAGDHDPALHHQNVCHRPGGSSQGI